MSQNNLDNPLGSAPIGKLLRKFAIPSIISMLVGALYNIVDQIFIGQKLGELGNGATNIAFPLSIICTAFSLLLGIGGASAFNLAMGRQETEDAGYYVGNAIVSMASFGTILMILVEIFLTPLLKIFGSTDAILPYATEYTRVIAFGFPFLMLGVGGGHLIRADGSPTMTMACNLVGAIVNTILDYIFIFVFDMGMTGAALATIIGQIVSATIAIIYFSNYKTVKLTKEHLKLRLKYIFKVTSLGLAPCSNQLAMMVVQIAMNNSLKYYGGLSSYGDSIPIACSGIVAKVNMVFFSFIIGVSQGLQPIVSYNYGAGKYDRVKKAYLGAIKTGFCMSLVSFTVFQLCPRYIISLFGKGSEEYYSFAESFFKIFLFFTFINFCQPITSNFFTAIGKPVKGVFLSLTRQILFLLPLILILPLIWGIDGILYAGPLADATAGIVAFMMVRHELIKPEFKALSK